MLNARCILRVEFCHGEKTASIWWFKKNDVQFNGTNVCLWWTYDIEIYKMVKFMHWHQRINLGLRTNGENLVSPYITQCNGDNCVYQVRRKTNSHHIYMKKSVHPVPSANIQWWLIGLAVSQRLPLPMNSWLWNHMLDWTGSNLDKMYIIYQKLQIKSHDSWIEYEIYSEIWMIRFDRQFWFEIWIFKLDHIGFSFTGHTNAHSQTASRIDHKKNVVSLFALDARVIVIIIFHFTTHSFYDYINFSDPISIKQSVMFSLT